MIVVPGSNGTTVPIKPIAISNRVVVHQSVSVIGVCSNRYHRRTAQASTDDNTSSRAFALLLQKTSDIL
jgi:hypothetical protein